MPAVSDKRKIGNNEKAKKKKREMMERRRKYERERIDEEQEPNKTARFLRPLFFSGIVPGIPGFGVAS